MKTSNPIVNKLIKRIRACGRGAVFSNADFLGLGSRAALDQALSRLARQEVICRLAPGLYHYPRINPKLGGVINPLPDAVAKAVARKSGNRIIPSGAMAANIMGLSTQVPAKAIYLINGQPRKVRFGSQTVIFRSAAPRTMAVSGRVSAIVFQALRHMGRGNVTDSMVSQLQRTLSAKDKRVLRKDICHAAAWMKPILVRIAGDEEGE
jgi:hypothetical protein